MLPQMSFLDLTKNTTVYTTNSQQGSNIKTQCYVLENERRRKRRRNTNELNWETETQNDKNVVDDVGAVKSR